MLPLIRSARSEEDLIAIWRYVAIEKNSPDAADNLLRTIDSRIQMLAHSPYLGERQPQFDERTRRLIIGNYVAYYDLLPDAVHVLRIFHTSRNIEQLFTKE